MASALLPELDYTCESVPFLGTYAGVLCLTPLRSTCALFWQIATLLAAAGLVQRLLSIAVLASFLRSSGQGTARPSPVQRLSVLKRTAHAAEQAQ